MANRFNPSINIVRDEGREFDYILTPNAVKVAKEISVGFNSGIRAFTLIGSYGTGKSSFLQALDRTINGGNLVPIELNQKLSKVGATRVVGHYQSLISYFTQELGVTNQHEGNQEVFDALYARAEKDDLHVIYIDEFGKFLEYATQNEPDRELYFLQQLAEFVSRDDINLLLITTLHQNFEAYSGGVVTTRQRREWKKVKGRFKELTFNEPVEQLLYLAAKKLDGQGRIEHSTAKLAIEKNVLDLNKEGLLELEKSLSPLDVISAGVLAKALQKYGQNERSLFTFLETDLLDEAWFDLSRVYDYLLNAFHSYLESSYNPHFHNWQTLKNGVERIEYSNVKKPRLMLSVFKSVGLLQIFGGKAGKIDDAFFTDYFAAIASKKDILAALSELQKMRLILFAKYKGAYTITEGTDVDFDVELAKAEEHIDPSFDVPAVVQEHFDFPMMTAKAVTYLKGTPRLFGFQVSDKAEKEQTPKGALDGYVRLVFNDDLSTKDILAATKSHSTALIVGFYKNTKSIRDRVFDILKTKKVLAEHRDDLVARSEFEKILASQERLLSHEVIDGMFTDKVFWSFQGEVISDVSNAKRLNAQLSRICNVVYSATPTFKNELLNKHKISTSIHTARKNYFDRLVNHWQEPELGFDRDKFPPEKTIYKSLLEANGIHEGGAVKANFSEPHAENGFDAIWEVCDAFLAESKEEAKPVKELYERLSKAPYKLKLGLLDFLVPSYLFIKRGEFALFDGDRFIPSMNESILYLITRQPQAYSVKAFEIDANRLEVFNRYRVVLDQAPTEQLSQSELIESVKPFLVFYKHLDDYTKHTNRLPVQAKALRESIKGAKDLEQTFFSTIPRALDMGGELDQSEEDQLQEFTARLNNAIEELKTAYPQLLDRFELFLCKEATGRKMAFDSYKPIIAERFGGIPEHRLLRDQKVFIDRVCSPLDDRDSWLASVAQAILKKPFNTISDHEEEILKDRVRAMLKGLDNLLEIETAKVEQGERLERLEITSDEGTKAINVRINQEDEKSIQEVSGEIYKLLDRHRGLELAILSELLKKQIGND